MWSSDQTAVWYTEQSIPVTNTRLPVHTQIYDVRSSPLILVCFPSLRVSSSVPDDYIGRRNLEHVEALQENQVNQNQVVIGYGRGLVVIWDLEKQCAIQHIPATQVTYQ